MKTILTTTLIGLLAVVIIGLATQMYSLRQQAYDIGYQDGLLVLPSIEDIQRRVGAKVDGKVSPDWRHSETQVKWEAEYGQRGADVWINNASMGIEK